MDDQAIIDRAIRAHYLTCRRRGVIHMQPARRSCRVTKHKGDYFAVLANGCGTADETLAVYRVHLKPWGDFRLVGQSSWPTAVVTAAW